MTFEEDTLATQNQENVLFADFIDPKIEVKSSTINDENINSVTVRLKATDKYFTPESVISEDKVKVMIDGQYATEAQGIHISFGTEEELYTTRNSATAQYGVIQNITVTGIADKLDKNIQLVIEEGAVADLSANTNEETKISLFNWLKDASSENTVSSAFLGMTTTTGAALQRQNIQSVEFLNSTATAPSKVISQATKVFDVSASQDGSIIAWYTGTGPYQVYIASDYPMYANPNSTNLFRAIGYGTSCTDTQVIKNLNLLNTNFVTNMSYMFNGTGYRSMTSLDLGDNFVTNRVTNMQYMFASTGYNKMTSLDLGESFDTKNVTNMANMFNSTGYIAMTNFDLGDNFDTSKVQSMNGMFQNFGQTKMTSLYLGNKFYTTSATNMTNMFNGCGRTAMTSLDLGPAFTKIASTNGNFATNCGKSGTIKIYVGSSIYSSKNAFKLGTDSSTTISYTIGTIVPKYKPEWTKTYSTYDSANQRLIVRLEGKVNATNYADAIKTVTNNFSNGELSEDSVFSNQKIRVRIDGEEASTIQKELSMVVNGPAETVSCEIILDNFIQTTMQSGKSYFEWAGNVALQIASEMLVDAYGNGTLEQSDEQGTMQRVEIKDSATTDHMIDNMMFADFVKPVITYEYSSADINQTEKAAQIVFDVTDKYYASENISLDNLTILMDGTNLKQTPVNIGLSEENITESGKTVGRRYTLTLSELQQDIIATGKSYLDFSGPVTLSVPGGVVTDKSGNTNNAKTITVGIDEKNYTDNPDDGSGVIVDVVDPVWTNVENGVTLDLANRKATVKVKATDKYFKQSTLTSSDIKFYLDGVATTPGSVSISSPTSITETRLVNGVSSNVQIGAEYTITITGINLDANEAKLEIVAGAIEDQSGNQSAANEIILYSRLKSASTESAATSPFLGGPTSIQRQNIESVEFVSGISGSTDEGVQQVWDVSALGDESILAWTKQTSAPYTVYIGSEGAMLANKNSSYLFNSIGYATSCNKTEVIKNIELIDTSSVTDMSYMFKNTGYNAMTTLDLGSNFDTSNVTNMRYMFDATGYKKMTTLTLGSKFNTSKVTNMDRMFRDCGYTELTALNLGSHFNTAKVTNMSGMFARVGYNKLTSLNLGSNFDTSSVTDMSYMFYNTGYTSMTTLTLGSKFNTAKVTNMLSMFQNCGASKLTSLNLGGLFYTTSVADMTDMFNGCGQVSMTTLDLGPAFTKIASTNTDFMTNCGKPDEITIYAGSAIYANENAFRLSANSDTTIEFNRGTINPKYQPEWNVGTFTANTTNSTLTITLQGTVDATNYVNYTKTVTNKFVNGTTALVEVSVDGDASANDTITKTISGANSTQGQTVTCTLTLTNFVESVRQSGKSFLEWAGDVTLKYMENTLVDSYGNPSLEKSDDTEMFADFIKPEFTYEYYDTEINTDTKIVTIYFSVTDKYFKQSTINANNITVKVDEDAAANSVITKTLTKVEDIVYGTDNHKVGERYQLVIEGLDSGDGHNYSGPMTLSFPAGVVTDDANNSSLAKTITIGIDDPTTGDGHDSEVIVDVVDPIWKIENLTETTADLIATDKYLSKYPLTAEEIKNQIQVTL